jgi:YVTN family beta-propeller protein
MKSIQLSYLLGSIALLTAITSCHKDKIVNNQATPTAQRAGIYILDQGYSSQLSALTYYDYTTKTLTPDIFSLVNGRSLGNTANDVEIYGSKMYIAVDKSGTVEVLNAKTAKSIKQVKFLNSDKDSTSKEPRSIAFYNGNAYISLYNGTVAVMDTITYTVSKYIPVGNDPEQLAVANGKLYVANSGGLNYPAVDSTVSVINLSTSTVTKTITVGPDPYAVSVDSYGNVYVAAYGVFGTSNASLTIINSSTDAVTSRNNSYTGGPFAINGNNAFYIDGDGTIKIFNVKTFTSTTTNFISDGTTFVAPFAIATDPLSGEVFVTDAKNYSSNGLIYAFDKTGKKEYSLTTGINPGSIVLVNK